MLCMFSAGILRAFRAFACVLCVYRVYIVSTCCMYVGHQALARAAHWLTNDEALFALVDSMNNEQQQHQQQHWWWSVNFGKHSAFGVQTLRTYEPHQHTVREAACGFRFARKITRTGDQYMDIHAPQKPCVRQTDASVSFRFHRKPSRIAFARIYRVWIEIAFANTIQISHISGFWMVAIARVNTRATQSRFSMQKPWKFYSPKVNKHIFCLFIFIHFLGASFAR